MRFLKINLLNIILAISAIAAERVYLQEGMLTEGYKVIESAPLALDYTQYVSFYYNGEGEFSCGDLTFKLGADTVKVIQNSKVMMEWRRAPKWNYIGIDMKMGRIYLDSQTTNMNFSFEPVKTPAKFVWQGLLIVSNIVREDHYVQNGPRI